MLRTWKRTLRQFFKESSSDIHRVRIRFRVGDPSFLPRARLCALSIRAEDRPIFSGSWTG